MGYRTYADEDLRHAVAESRSWRGVLRSLGLKATSAAALRSVRHHADRLGLDYTHFTGQRRWTADELATAVASSRSWSQVAVALGLAGGSSSSALKGHALRLGIDAEHFNTSEAVPTGSPETDFDLGNLPRAGGLIAAAWLTLCGYEVSWPLEPCRYDLIAARGDQVLRIQVKTTRYNSAGSWRVSLSTGGRHPETYDPDDIDYFFIVDGDFDHYLIPVTEVAGLGTIHLSAYHRFRLAQPLVQPI